MKIKIFGLTIGAAAIVVALSGGIHQSVNAQQDTPPPDAQSSSEPADALPPDIQANAALVEVINLSQSGVNDEVIANYIGNSQSSFNLTASQIIYLKDLGLPDSTVTAMIQHDQQLGTPAPAPSTQTASTPAPVTTDVSDNGFYDSLAPYGTWVVVEGYGRCWRPAAVVYDSSWQPYCDHGHWIYTDDGWYWYSDYSWGWATFHYGRWFHNDRYGWCWYPDTVWGPSWVCWRYSDDYCGWAPLPPHCEYREGVGLVFNGSHVSVGFDFGLSIGAFTFVATRDFCDPHPWQHRVSHTQVTRIYNHTTVINNITINNNGGHNRTIINNGIPHDRIAAASHRTIPQMNIRESNSPVRRGENVEGGNTLVINRPHFEHAAATQNENSGTPHTIPSPTTGRPMQVSPPNENRNSNPRGRNESPAQNRNASPNQITVQPPAGNGNNNHNRNVENRSSYPAVTQPQQNQPPQNVNGHQNNPPQNGIDRYGSTLPSTQTQQQTPARNYPSVQSPTESQTPEYTPPAPRRPTVSPRYQQRSVTPQTAPRNYSEPGVQPPSPRVEIPQPAPRAYQSPPSQVAPQQSQPSQNQQPDHGRDRDKNDR